jgi:hypothetical protein
MLEQLFAGSVCIGDLLKPSLGLHLMQFCPSRERDSSFDIALLMGKCATKDGANKVGH